MRIGRRLIGFIGLCGIGLCLVTMVVLWLSETKLTQSVDRLFGVADHSFEVIVDRVKQSQVGVEQSRVIAVKLSESLKENLDDSDVVSRIRQGSDQLESTLSQVDHWLEVSQSVLQLLSDMVAEAKHEKLSTSVESLNESVASARNRLAGLATTVGSIQKQAAQAGQQTIDEQSLKLVEQILSLLPEVDSHLHKFTDKLSATQDELRTSNVHVRKRIAMVAIAATVIIVWMGLGQLALCGWGWSKTTMSATSNKT